MHLGTLAVATFVATRKLGPPACVFKKFGRELQFERKIGQQFHAVIRYEIVILDPHAGFQDAVIVESRLGGKDEEEAPQSQSPRLETPRRKRVVGKAKGTRRGTKKRPGVKRKRRKPGG